MSQSPELPLDRHKYSSSPGTAPRHAAPRVGGSVGAGGQPMGQPAGRYRAGWGLGGRPSHSVVLARLARLAPKECFGVASALCGHVWAGCMVAVEPPGGGTGGASMWLGRGGFESKSFLLAVEPCRALQSLAAVPRVSVVGRTRWGTPHCISLRTRSDLIWARRCWPGSGSYVSLTLRPGNDGQPRAA